MKEEIIINALSKGDRKVLAAIYTDYKSAFIAYARGFSLEEYEILDIYQDASIVLFENAMDNKLQNITCTVKTYLFSIGKYMIYEKLRKNKKTINTEITNLTTDYNYEIQYDELILSSQQKQLKSAFTKLGKQCQKLLNLFYYNGYTLDEITIILSYTNKDVVKSQKSRCIKQLKTIINKNG